MNNRVREFHILHISLSFNFINTISKMTVLSLRKGRDLPINHTHDYKKCVLSPEWSPFLETSRNTLASLTGTGTRHNRLTFNEASHHAVLSIITEEVRANDSHGPYPDLHCLLETKPVDRRKGTLLYIFLRDYNALITQSPKQTSI
jgi:hypothetical protein